MRVVNFADMSSNAKALGGHVGLALLCALWSACAAPLESPERFGVGPDAASAFTCASAAEVEEELLPMRCGTSLCHAAGESAAAGLDLVSPDMQARLAAATSSEACGSVPLLVPGDADNSLLFQKLGASPPCGSPMPLAQAPLSADELACISNWIGGTL